MILFLSLPLTFHAKNCKKGYVCDWLNGSIATLTSAEMPNKCIIPSIFYFHHRFSQWTTVRCLYEGSHKRYEGDCKACKQEEDEYIHSFLIIVHERDFEESQLLKPSDDSCKGWKIAICEKNELENPNSVRKLDCNPEIMELFGKRIIKFTPVNRVTFISKSQFFSPCTRLILCNGDRTAEIDFKKIERIKAPLCS